MQFNVKRTDMQMNKTVGTTAAPMLMPSVASGPWMSLFAVAALPLFLFQPSAFVTLSMAGTASLATVVFAHMSVMNEKLFDSMHLAVKLLAPVQLALLIWLSVYAGHELAGASFAVSCLAAVASLAVFLAADAMISAILLLIAARGQRAMGVSIVSLISAKYSGLFGEIS